MPIPAFDRFGLLPGGIHECTIKEVEVDLAWNDERRLLTDLLQEFIAVELTPRFTVVPPVVLDGSYVSQKASPNNIREPRKMPFFWKGLEAAKKAGGSPPASL
ncbi:MAG: hypothetical protein FJ060_00025 [Cyanobacteria bacterium K_Offshore_0m_m2_072]|nr:hypothetical protein [Cyanobacteria bacterium K_Offshore_0m_m2_072]